jgi:hypothetical protein
MKDIRNVRRVISLGYAQGYSFIFEAKVGDSWYTYGPDCFGNWSNINGVPNYTLPDCNDINTVPYGWNYLNERFGNLPLEKDDSVMFPVFLITDEYENQISKLVGLFNTEASAKDFAKELNDEFERCGVNSACTFDKTYDFARNHRKFPISISYTTGILAVVSVAVPKNPKSLWV